MAGGEPQAKRSQGDVLLEEAEQLLAHGEPADALRAAKEALERFRQAKDEVKVREALKSVCSALIADGDYEEGLKMAAAEVEECKKAGNKKGQAELLVVLADLHVLAEQPQQGTQAATDAQELFAELEDLQGIGKALRAALYAYLARGKKKTALKVAKQALALSQSTDDKAAEAASWNQLGLARMQNNKLDEVPQALNEALSIYKETGDKARQGSTLTSLAAFNLAKGSASEALELAEQARRLCQEAGLFAAAAEAWDVSVAAYMSLGRAVEVAKVAKAELSACKKAGNGEKIAAAEQRLIRASLRMGEEDAAMHAAKRACARMSESGDWKGQAAMLRVAAVLHLRCERVELALRAAQEALALLRAHKGREEHAWEQAALQTVIAEAHTKRGEEPPRTASRAAALGALEELGQALREKKVEAFEGALRRLQKSGAYTTQDTKAALDPIVTKDKAAAKFVQRHLPSSEILVDPQKKMRVTTLRRFEADPAGGVVSGVEWAQTMCKLTVSYALDDDVTEDQVKVELSGYQVQVTIAGKKFAPLTGVFWSKILLRRSWWLVQAEQVKRRGRGVDMNAKKLTLVIQMLKAEHKAWPELWHTVQGELKHPAVKARYCWTAEMQKQADADVQERGPLTALPPGKPPDLPEPQPDDPVVEAGLFTPQSDKFRFAPDEIVVGVDATQDTKTITIRIIFDGEALRVVQEQVALDDILAADIWEDHVSIFLRGDEQNPILYGQLWSSCVPYLSKWKMTNDDSFRTRQIDFMAMAPVLKITMTKSEDAQCRWSKIFSNCWQHRLMLKNYDELEGLLAMLKEDQNSGNLTYEARDELYQRLSEWREDRFPGMPGAQRLTRRGNDNMDSDFYANLRTTVDEIAKRTGCEGRARWNEELGRFSYIY